MKQILISAAIVAALMVVVASADLQGQGATAAPATPVAIVDINYIFKKHARFNQQHKNWEEDFKAADADFKKEAEGLKKLVESLQGLKPGTEEFKSTEKACAERQADLQVKAQLKQKEMREAEAKIYLNCYREVTKTIEDFSAQRGVSLVLRFNGDAVDPADPQSIGREYAKSVVYQRGCDITPDILAIVNRNVQSARPPRGALQK